VDRFHAAPMAPTPTAEPKPRERLRRHGLAPMEQERNVCRVDATAAQADLDGAVQPAAGADAPCEVLFRPLAIPRLSIELAETEVTVGDEGAHSAWVVDPTAAGVAQGSSFAIGNDHGLIRSAVRPSGSHSCTRCHTVSPASCA